MTVNLLNMLKDQVSDELARNASSFLGETEDTTREGLSAIFPTLLGTMIGKSEEPNGTQGLMGMIDKLDNNLVDNISSLFGGGASSVNGILNSGGSIVDMLLGNKMSGVVDIIRNISGMKSGSASSLIKMAAPFLMSLIGKQISGQGASGLKDLLLSQKEAVQQAMPAGIENILGFSAVASDVDATARATTAKMTDTAEKARLEATQSTPDSTVAADVESGGMGWLKWLLPLLLLLLVGYWFTQRGCGAEIEQAAEDTVAATEEAMEDTGDAISDAADWTMEGIRSTFANVDESARETLKTIEFKAESAGDQMMDYIEGGFDGDPVFTFTNLNYATNSAEIDAKSNQEIENVVSIMKAYPDVKLRIEGHTDNMGDAAANKQLSQARAEAVKAKMQAQGITANRLEAVGYGQDEPIASNDTEAGRSQNRRTVLRLIK